MSEPLDTPPQTNGERTDILDIMPAEVPGNAYLQRGLIGEKKQKALKAERAPDCRKPT